MKQWTPLCLGFALGVTTLAGCQQESPSAKFQTYDQMLAKENSSLASSASSTGSPLTAKDDDGGFVVSVKEDPFAEEGLKPAPRVDETPEIAVSALVPLNVVDGSSAADILKVSARTDKPISPAPPAGPGAAVASSSQTVPPAVPLPGGVRLLIPERSFKTEGTPPALRVSYDDLDLLKILNMEPVPENAVESFPDWLKELNGKTIRIRGFMFPTFEASGIEQFVLARDNQICCFGRNPKVYDLIAVSLSPKSTTNYIPNRPFDVIGTFRIEMLAEGGELMGLYWLENARVIDR